MAKSKLEHKPNGFNLGLQGSDLNGNCKACGVIATIEYRGLDPAHPDFHVICEGCKTYTLLKIRMVPKYLNPQPYRGVMLFHKWHVKIERAAFRAAKKKATR